MSVIIAALDFSELNEKVLATARELARESSSSLHLLHAVTSIPNFVDWDGGSHWVHNYPAQSMKEVRSYQNELHQEEKRRLEALAEQLRSEGIDAQAFLVEGPAVEVILDHVKAHDTRMLVVGSHGHGSLYHLVAGSVTTELLKKSPVPVLVEPIKAAVLA